MAKDAKLEQLKIAQDQAFSKKQDAYQAQQISWDRLSNARDKMNGAFEIKQNAHQSQNQAWQDYRSVCERNGTRIEYLNSAQERAFQNMKDAFDRASSAHDRRDGLSAKNYATEGHNYKSEAQVYVQERRRLVEDCRSAKTRHEPYKRAFEDAKIAFGRAKDEHEQAKATHERANTEFKRAKEEFNAAAKAFQSRLSELKAQKSKKKLNNRALAAKAGVPYQYRDDVYVSEDSDGTVNIFFGGFGTPDGPGHGHYSMDSYGKVTYKRDPWDQHGSQNFSDSKRDYFDVIMQEIAAANGMDFAFNCIFRGVPAYVESNYSRDSQRKIDIFYGANGPLGVGHNHAGARIESPHDLIFDEVR